MNEREQAKLQLRRDWKKLNGAELGKRITAYFKEFVPTPEELTKYPEGLEFFSRPL